MLNSFIKQKQNNNTGHDSRALLKCLKRLKNRHFSSLFKSGDNSAFEKIYSQYHGPILSYVKRKIHDPNIAEEITQEIFFKAHRFRETYDPQFEFSTWIWTIARNTLSDWFRKHSQGASLREDLDGEILNIEDFPSSKPNPEHLLLETAHRETFAKMMGVLTDLQRRALMLRLIYQLPYHEIAKRMNVTSSSVKCLIHRAKTTLTEKIAETAEGVSLSGQLDWLS